MPISAEQWRGAVGNNNAASSHVLRKCIRKKYPKSLLSLFLSLLVALFAPGVGLVDNRGKNDPLYREGTKASPHSQSIQYPVMRGLFPVHVRAVADPPPRETRGSIGSRYVWRLALLCSLSSSVAQGMWRLTLDHYVRLHVTM